MLNEYRAWSKELNVMVYDNEDDSSDYWDGAVGSNIGMLNYILNYYSKAYEYEYMQLLYIQEDGTKIYDGDILDYDGMLFYIAKNDYNIGYAVYPCNGEMMQISLTKGMLDDMTKKGNVWENKDLLKSMCKTNKNTLSEIGGGNMNKTFEQLVLEFLGEMVIENECYGKNEITLNLKDVNHEVSGEPWENWLKQYLKSHNHAVRFSYGDGHWVTVHKFK